MFTLNPKSTTPLVVQIVEGFRVAIQNGGLRPGAKAPSIRQFAHAHGVSTYTVVDAYDRLLGPLKADPVVVPAAALFYVFYLAMVTRLAVLHHGCAQPKARKPRAPKAKAAAL